MFTPLARVLIGLAPLIALYLAYRFFRNDKGLYIELLCWSYIACSFVRRVVDFQSGLTESVLLAVPLIVLLVPLGYLLTQWTRVFSRSNAPFGYLMMALVYGSVLAVLGFHTGELFAELPLWLLPLCLGIYLYGERKDAEQLFAGFERAMVGGTLFAGVYGLIQYFALPAWDAAWMVQTEMVTIGKPEPLEVRVFSVMNAPQILAAFLVVGILLAYRSKLRYRWPAVASGIITLTLSGARTAWIALVAAFLYLVFRSSMKERVRTLTFIGGCAVVLVVSMLIPAVNETVSSRFASFSNGAQDDSAADRSETYAAVLHDLTIQPFGRGIGVNEGDMEDAKHDSSLVNMFVSLGVFGSLMYVAGFSGILKRVLLPGSVNSAHLLTLQTTAVALLAETPLNNILNGPIAFLLWSVLALGLALAEAQAAPVALRELSRRQQLVETSA